MFIHYIDEASVAGVLKARNGCLVQSVIYPRNLLDDGVPSAGLPEVNLR